MQALQTQKKRALLMGLNYPFDPSAKLLGCANDARSMGKYLTTTCGFKPAQVSVLTDEDIRSAALLGKDGIVDALYNLCIASWAENLDLVVFHYSGHGSQMRDANMDEKDNLDEALVPVDFRSRGLITDDFLRALFTKFNPKTKVLCFYDSCHSGTMMDLPYSYDMQKAGDNGQRTTKITSGCAKIYCISGCMDNQVSMDATDPLTKAPAGAMTACVLKLLSDKGAGGYPALQLQADLNKLLMGRGFVQRPVLTSSMPVGAADLWI